MGNKTLETIRLEAALAETGEVLGLMASCKDGGLKNGIVVPCDLVGRTRTALDALCSATGSCGNDDAASMASSLKDRFERVFAAQSPVGKKAVLVTMREVRCFLPDDFAALLGQCGHQAPSTGGPWR